MPSLNIVPGYTILVLDTNVILSSLSAVASIMESLRWTIVIPVPCHNGTGRPVLKSVEAWRSCSGSCGVHSSAFLSPSLILAHPHIVPPVQHFPAPSPRPSAPFQHFPASCSSPMRCASPTPHPNAQGPSQDGRDCWKTPGPQKPKTFDTPLHLQ